MSASALIPWRLKTPQYEHGRRGASGFLSRMASSEDVMSSIAKKSCSAKEVVMNSTSSISHSCAAASMEGGRYPSMPSSTHPATRRTSGLLPMRSTSIDSNTAESLPPEIATRTVVGPSMVSCFRSSRPTFFRTERSR